MLKLTRVFVERLRVDEDAGTDEVSLKIEDIQSMETMEVSNFKGEKREITRIHLHGSVFPVYVKETTMEIAKRMFENR